MQYVRDRLSVMPRPHRLVSRPATAPARADAPLSRVDTILRLQQTAGNAAVQRALTVQRDAAHDERLARAVSGGDWAGAATILLPADEHWMVEKLHSLRPDQLRYLDDAVRRMGVINSRLRVFIKAGLMQLGATVDTALPGAGFGVIEGKATKITDGKVQPGGNKPASYKFEVTFLPNAGAVDATLIEFIQMATVVSTVNSTPDPVGHANPNNAGANGGARQTADHARVDRVPGMNEGWIGVHNNGKPGDHLRPWHRGDKTPAWMTDTPSRSVPNVSFDFETAAICRAGKDAGTIYATVRWGFTIDAAMKVVPKDPVYFNKESNDFDLAVIFWNAESATTGSTQKPLPGNLH